MAEAEISRELLSDKVYNLIRASILDGSREPGSRVVESEIARRLNVSQAPVREAVKRLVHAGLVTSEPRYGSFVTEMSQDEFAIARELRASLESIGARSAIESLTPEDIEQLSAIVGRMERSVAAGEWGEFRDLDMEFHRRVLSVGGHAVLTRMWDTLEPVLISQRAIGDPTYRGDRVAVVGWHRELIEALESGDAVAASAAFAAHASGALGDGH